MEHIPQWARRMGFVGLIIFILLIVVKQAVEAIFEQKIQNLWMNYAEPFLLSSVKIEVQVWHLLAAASLVVVGLVIYLFVRKPPRLVGSRLNPRRIGSPKRGNGYDEAHGFDKVDVIKARESIKDGELSIGEFAVIVEQAVNSGNLRAEVGAELLEDFGHELVLRSDRTYTARQRRRQR
jgi:hypothetical protein